MNYPCSSQRPKHNVVMKWLFVQQNLFTFLLNTQLDYVFSDFPVFFRFSTHDPSFSIFSCLVLEFRESGGL